MGDILGLQVDLECQQQGEEELVVLVEAPGRVAEHLVGEVLHDVAKALGGDLRLGGLLHGRVEDAQELPQGGLIHDVHQAHLHNQEVEDAAPCGHRPVFLPRKVDLHLRFRCHG